MPNPNNSVFPNAVATDSNLPVATNRALSNLTQPINASQTQITVGSGSTFQYPCIVQIDTEVILVSSIVGNNFMGCVRGFDNTLPASHGQNADVKGYVLDYHNNQIAAEIKAIEAGLGPNFSNVVMQDDQAGGTYIGGVFSNLYLRNNGVAAGTYGGFNVNVLISVDSTGRISQISNAPGNINYPIIYKAAIAQGANCVLGFSFGSDHSPNALIVDGGSGLVYGVAEFTSGNDYWVQDHFYLPDDWPGPNAPGTQGLMSLDIYWRSPVATTGNVRWGVRVGVLRAGIGPDITWNDFAYIVDTCPTSAGVTSKCRITPLFVAGIQGGDELFFQFERNGTNVLDTSVGIADLISIKFNINRNFSLVQ